MPKKWTRVRLTHGQKEVLRVHRQEHLKKSLRVLCEWAHVEFGLQHPPSPATLLMLFKSSEQATGTSPATKTLHPVTSPRLEADLVRWIGLCEQLELPIVNRATIRAKVIKIRETIMEEPASSNSSALARMVFSSCWIEKLQLRHGLKARRVHGEAASVSPEEVEAGRILLQCITSEFSKHDTFNMDETAFFYCMLPVSAIAGRKKVKKRLTVALASNADGTFNLPLLFVGTARQPRCFGGKTKNELDLEYVNAPKGWMNTQLFQAWIESFNATMRDEKRHVLLLLDNASCHRVSDPLSNVRVHMLPPNTTVHLQPQDAGIIQSFKAQVSHLKNRYYVDQLDDLLDRFAKDGKEKIEVSGKSFFDVDILMAMRWAKQA